MKTIIKFEIKIIEVPLFLAEDLKNKSTLIDCLIGELQQSINCAYVDKEITEEQCDYLYRKYIHGGK